MSTSNHPTNPANEPRPNLAALQQQLAEAQTQLKKYEARVRQLESDIETERALVRQTAAEQKTIIETAETLFRVENSDELWSQLATAVRQSTKSDRSALSLLDPQKNQLTLIHSFGLSETYLEFIQKWHQESPNPQLSYRTPIIVQDVATDPAAAPLRSHLTEEGIQAFAVLPLVSPQNRLVGILVLYRNELRPFTEKELSLGQTLCQIGTYAQNKINLLNETQENLRREQHLKEIAQTLSNVFDLPTILNSIIRMATKLIGADAGLLGLILEDQLITYYPYNIPTQINLQPTTQKKAAAWQISHSHQPLIIPDYPAHQTADPKWVKAGVRTLAGVPILSGDQCLGAIILLNLHEHQRPFTQRDLNLLEAVGHQAGIAIQNARIVAENEKRANLLAQMLSRQAELDELKNKFIQSVSHELRAPLGIILGNVELLHQSLIDDLQPEQRQAMDIIMRRTRMVSDLVDDLSTLLAAQTQELRRETINAVDLIYSMLADYQIQAAEAKLTLHADIASDLPMIQGDINHLRRVFDNLMSNAFKFTPAGGVVSIQVWAADNNVIIEVTDTGSGIPEKDIKYIFERFYQVEDKGYHRPGTGLGLALVKEIVEAHGGDVSVASQAGKGSSFTIKLPGFPPLDTGTDQG